MDLLTIIESFLINLAAVAVALLIDRMRMPKLKIHVDESANGDVTYQPGHNLAGQRWKFFRVFVENKRMPKIFSWLFRQTAENCRAIITISGVNNPTGFSYKGRWASTPELPFYQQLGVVKIFDPDPVTILAGNKEILDVITKYEHDAPAYGWNNEAYLETSNWRTQGYRLNPGRYRINILVTSQNGVSATKEFFLTVAITIQDTRFNVNNI
jgi:hypothetical protein